MVGSVGNGVCKNHLVQRRNKTELIGIFFITCLILFFYGIIINRLSINRLTYILYYNVM